MMKTLGLKLTHDASIAMIDDNQLLFSVEIEKLNNNPRYTKMPSVESIYNVLETYSEKLPENIVVDGWKSTTLPWNNSKIKAAPYCEFTPELTHNPTRRWSMIDTEMGFNKYSSYTHITTHIIGSYAMSPYAATNEIVAVIVWDGGQNPRAYIVNPRLKFHNSIKFIDSLHEIYGTIYSIMSYYWGPFKDNSIIECPHNPVDKLPPGHAHVYGGYEKPGKIMAYVGLGQKIDSVIDTMRLIYHKYEYHIKNNSDKYLLRPTGHFEHELCREFYLHPQIRNHSDENIIASLHYFLEELFIERAKKHIHKSMPVIFTGGCALNIKWNAALRRHFSEVWVPPVPNDTGNAIGAAMCEQVYHNDKWNLRWDVYSGPQIIVNEQTPEGWTCQPCNTYELAMILKGQPFNPVIVLNGKAELGPRALGNRSILMDARWTNNKVLLNKIKNREQFRPVSPICLEQHAKEWFSPGVPDPYMLFEHDVWPAKQPMIPAVVHVDGSARLQTINHYQNRIVNEILVAYYSLTGIPVLCNTSANNNGSGFFPDIASAAEWAKNVSIHYIWNNGVLYERNIIRQTSDIRINAQEQEIGIRD